MPSSSSSSRRNSDTRHHRRSRRHSDSRRHRRRSQERQHEHGGSDSLRARSLFDIDADVCKVLAEGTSEVLASLWEFSHRDAREMERNCVNLRQLTAADLERELTYMRGLERLLWERDIRRPDQFLGRYFALCADTPYMYVGNFVAGSARDQATTVRKLYEKTLACLQISSAGDEGSTSTRSSSRTWTRLGPSSKPEPGPAAEPEHALERGPGPPGARADLDTRSDARSDTRLSAGAQTIPSALSSGRWADDASTGSHSLLARGARGEDGRRKDSQGQGARQQEREYESEQDRGQDRGQGGEQDRQNEEMQGRGDREGAQVLGRGGAGAGGDTPSAQISVRPEDSVSNIVARPAPAGSERVPENIKSAPAAGEGGAAAPEERSWVPPGVQVVTHLTAAHLSQLAHGRVPSSDVQHPSRLTAAHQSGLVQSRQTRLYQLQSAEAELASKSGLRQPALPQSGLHQPVLDQLGPRQAVLDQSGLHQSGLHQAALDQSGLHQTGVIPGTNSAFSPLPGAEPASYASHAGEGHRDRNDAANREVLADHPPRDFAPLRPSLAVTRAPERFGAVHTPLAQASGVRAADTGPSSIAGSRRFAADPPSNLSSHRPVWRDNPDVMLARVSAIETVAYPENGSDRPRPGSHAAIVYDGENRCFESSSAGDGADDKA